MGKSPEYISTCIIYENPDEDELEPESQETSYRSINPKGNAPGRDKEPGSMTRRGMNVLLREQRYGKPGCMGRHEISFNPFECAEQQHCSHPCRPAKIKRVIAQHLSEPEE
jgi:hypothetical protein